MRNLADPTYEPTDEELVQLAREAFAGIRLGGHGKPARAASKSKKREDEQRRRRIAEARARLLASLEANKE